MKQTEKFCFVLFNITCAKYILLIPRTPNFVVNSKDSKMNSNLNNQIERLPVYLYEYDYPSWFDDELTTIRPDWQCLPDPENWNVIYGFDYPSYLDEEYPDYDSDDSYD